MSYVLSLVFASIVFLLSFLIPKESEENNFILQRYQMIIISIFLFVSLTIINSFIITDTGKVVVVNLFGEMREKTYEEGIHLANPFLSTESMNIRRLSVNFTGEQTAEGLSSNKVELTIDTTIPYILNPKMAWKVYQRYGKINLNLIVPAARNAVRDCASRFTWEHATSKDGRRDLAKCISNRQSKIVYSDLVKAGFTSKEALTTFTFPNTQLRKVVPIRDSILASVAEEQSAQVDLRRQVILTKIAKEEANRRSNDGIGIRRMMEKLPKDFTIDQMVAIINANSGKNNSEAFMKAVEKGNPNITIVTGGNSGKASIAIPTKATSVTSN